MRPQDWRHETGVDVYTWTAPRRVLELPHCTFLYRCIRRCAASTMCAFRQLDRRTKSLHALSSKTQHICNQTQAHQVRAKLHSNSWRHTMLGRGFPDLEANSSASLSRSLVSPSGKAVNRPGPDRTAAPQPLEKQLILARNQIAELLWALVTHTRQPYSVSNTTNPHQQPPAALTTMTQHQSVSAQICR